MTPKQRFEKLVFKARHTPNTLECLSFVDAVQLLLAEHRRVRALVQRVKARSHKNIVANREEIDCNLGRCYEQACDDILKALAGQKEEP